MKAFKHYSFLLLAFLALIWCPIGVSAQIPEKPINSTVVDQTGLLSKESIAQIDAENQAWAQTDQQLQVGVLLLETLSGQQLETLANETFRKWQIGFSETNNGVLLVVAIKDRAFRLETSDQAATVLTDIEAKQILEASRDFFRSEDYDGGILYLVDAIGDRFYGTDRAQVRLEKQAEESSSDSGFAEFLMVLFVIVLIIILTSQSGGRGGRGGGRDLLWLLLASQSSSSSRSDSSTFGGGGSGWSGGGGGGGGASSGW